MKAPLNIQALFHDAALYDTEAIPEGILLMYPAEDTPRKMGYARALQHLDGGGSDDNLSAGMRLAAALLEGIQVGWYSPAEAESLALWRWIAVAVFIQEQQALCNTAAVEDKHGRTVEAVLYDEGKTVVALVPAVERRMLAQHVEQATQRFCPAEACPDLTLRMYQDMLAVSDDESGVCLTVWGHSAFRILHEWLSDSLTNVSGSPVRH